MTQTPPTITPALLAAAVGCPPHVAERFAPWVDRACWHYGILGPLRTGAFLGQIAHESTGLQKTEESLNYTTPARIRAVWPSRFATDADAAPFVRDPQALANHVYGGRMGNQASDDGWRYRGRGLIQLTGRDNYARAADALGADFIATPELVATPQWAALTAAWFWSRNGLNALADREDHVAITRRINGGLHGLEDRIDRTRRATHALISKEA